MGEQHVVPLSKQALVLLRELHLLMEAVGMYFRLFAGLKAHERKHGERSASPARLHQRRDDGHGFRSLASTNLTKRAITGPD